MGRISISALLLASTGVLCSATSQLEVTAVRFWTLPEVTRVAIETNGGFRFRSDRLNNPDRLFFDLLAAKPRVTIRGVQVTPVGDKLLKRIRVAETQPGMTRVVLDLESAVDFNASQLSNPDRLMIELRPAPQGAETPAPVVPNPAVPNSAVPNSVTQRPVSSNRPTPSQDAKPAAKSAEPSAAQISPASSVESSEVQADSAPAGERALAAKLEPAKLDSSRLDSSRPGPVRVKAIEAPPRLISPVPPPALAAKRMSTGDRTLVRELGLKVGRVVIDAGHGGHDHGSTGPGGLMEKELVLDVALRLGKLIGDRLGSEVIFTRSDDTFVPLETRTALANDSKADLFLSIHANSSPYPGVSGVETYYLNFAATRDAMDLASRENAGSQQTIHDLGDIIQKITKHDKAEESREFAGKMQTALYSVASKSNPAVRNRGVKKAPFVVLIGARMPSILAEIGFVSNSREENLLKRPDHRQKLAEALYRGLSRYAETLSHYQVAARD